MENQPKYLMAMAMSSFHGKNPHAMSLLGNKIAKIKIAQTKNYNMVLV
jgi:hypothetical protein